MSIYKACDIRGIFPKEIDESTAHKIGRAVGTKLGGGSVIVGNDVRLSSPILKRGLVKGLVQSGCRVIDLGTIPTPLFYYALKYLHVPTGVMVTASHNPKEYNGFKLSLGPQPVSGKDIEEIRGLVEKETFLQGVGKVEERMDLSNPYLGFILGQFDQAGKLKVVIDAANGCMGEIAPLAFSKLGYRVVKLHCRADGEFPAHPPNPAVTENLSDLCRRVVEESANLGIAFDGDGDRVVFVDDRGQPISGDKSIVVFVRYLLAKKPKSKVVYDLKCSSVVAETIREMGGIALMEKSGYAFIRRRMISEEALFGGELSGHFFYDHLGGGDDALFSALLMAEIVGQQGKPASQIVAEIPSYFITPDLRISYESGEKEKILERVKLALSDYDIQTLDGVRVQFENGWALMRISVTEPLFTFRFEGKTKRDLENAIENFLGAVPKDLAQKVIAKYGKYDLERKTICRQPK